MARHWRNRWLMLAERAMPVGERDHDAERSGAPAFVRYGASDSTGKRSLVTSQRTMTDLSVIGQPKN